MRVLRTSVLGRLVPTAAALVVGLLLGSAAPASAQNDGVLHACVRVDHWGEFRGPLRIVGANQRCAPWEAPVTLPLVGAGLQSSGGEWGGIKGVFTECGVPTARTMAYLNGHSFIVFIEADGAGHVTGEFEMHHVPPGTYDLHLIGTYNISLMSVTVKPGEVNDLGLQNICYLGGD